MYFGDYGLSLDEYVEQGGGSSVVFVFYVVYKTMSVQISNAVSRGAVGYTFSIV